MAIKTEIGFTTPEAITVRGRNLSEDLLGKLDFVDMLYLVAYGQSPTLPQKNMINALLVTACDHGLTPSALATRLTFLGAPESLQGAVAAGLLGAGSHFLGTIQNVSDTLTLEAASLTDDVSDEALAAHAIEVVQRYREKRTHIPGFGHPIHVAGDPRVPTLVEISRSNGFYGKHWRLAQALVEAMKSITGRVFPLNGAGACGAILAEMKLDPLFGRGLMLVGRAAGLVAHVMEEREAPTGQQIWDLVLTQDPRNIAPPPRGSR